MLQTCGYAADNSMQHGRNVRLGARDNLRVGIRLPDGLVHGGAVAPFF
jgi:hypothetical protein